MSIETIAGAAPEARQRYTDEEWETRIELAACYRMLARLRMTDLTGTHVSMRVPGEEEHYLLNPYGLLFEEITASSLIKFDLDGTILDETDFELNPAGYATHAGIHKVRSDAKCVMHTHTRWGCALGALDTELKMLNQMSLIFYERLAYTDYVFVEDIGQCGQLIEDLGDKQALVMRQHGLLTTGRTIPEAFILMFYLEKACQIQIDAMSSGGKLAEPSPEVCRAACDAWWRWYKDEPFGQIDWDALRRRMDDEGESYKH